MMGKKEEGRKGRKPMLKEKKLDVSEIVPCPQGHKDTYIVVDEAIIKEHGMLLGCNVCEDFYGLVPSES